MLRLVSAPPFPSGEGARTASPSGEERRADSLAPLTEQARAGDAAAQRTLLVAVGPAMLRVIRGVLGGAHPDVEDTLQDSMVALHLALSGFRGECTTQHFACRIAIQTAMNARRRSGYRTRHTPAHDPEELAELARDERSPSALALHEERREGLRRLVSELPEQQAEVLALHAVLGYTVEETAHVTAAPVNTVRSRLRNALAKLRARLESDGVLRETIGGEP
ncbi:MAG TPA: RNA polymerase sigma factor [Polyangiaceae bacterium]|nr:RNA polymerase sigma factor [Polyangiaceae bacterium]